MRARFPRASSATVAITLSVALAAWQPVALLHMARMQCQSMHHMHVPASHSPTSSPHCCGLCPCACAGSVDVAALEPHGVIAHVPTHDVGLIVEGAVPLWVAPPYRLPYPLGPPPLRQA